MTPNVIDIQRKRALFLHRLWEVSEQGARIGIGADAIGHELGLTETEVRAIVNYFEGKGLISDFGLLGARAVSITERGVDAVEAALSNPEKPTAFLPPFRDMIVVGGGAQNVQIQQGTRGSTQRGEFDDGGIAELSTFVQTLKGRLGILGLDPDGFAIAQASVDTAEIQSRSPRPNGTIIRECGRTLRSLVEGIAGNVAAAWLLEHWPKLFQ
jgi:hypothetical protein